MPRRSIPSVQPSRSLSGGWRIDPAANEMIAPDGRPVRIEARAMEVLAILLASPGVVVATEELLQRVWGGAAVSAHSVAIVISDLRRALGDDARAPRLLETVPKRGYRWIAPVVSEPEAVRTVRRRRLAWGVSIAAAALVLGTATAPRLVGRFGRSSTLGLDRATAEKYFQARQLWNRREPEGAVAARRLLEEVVAEREEFAPAHAALADLFVHKTGEYLGVPPLEAFRIGQRHLDRALELDPSEPDLHVTEALLAFFRDRQPRKALVALDRALQLDPDLARAWQTRGMVLSALGEHDASLVAIRRARQLDPASTAIGWDEVWFLYLANRPVEGLEALERESRITARNRFYEALLETSAGRPDDAVESWLSRLAERGVDLADPGRVRAHVAKGAIVEAYRELLAQLARVPGYTESAGVRMVLEVLADRPDEAATTLASLRAEEHETWIVPWIAEMPVFTSFVARSDVHSRLEREGFAPLEAFE